MLNHIDLSKGERIPFVFTWSSRHTRLRFQMFIAALLVYSVAAYGLESVQLFGVAKLKLTPPALTSFTVTMGFALFSIFSFAVRTYCEVPTLNENVNKVSRLYSALHSQLDKLKMEVEAIIEGETLKEFPWDTEIMLDANYERKEAFAEIKSIINLFDTWYNCLVKNGSVGPDFNALPTYYREFRTLSAESYEYNFHKNFPFKNVTDKMKISDMSVSSSNSNYSWDSIVSSRFADYSFDIKNISRQDFSNFQQSLKKQIREVKILKNRLKSGLLMRNLDIWVLSFFLPLIVSIGITVAAFNIFFQG